MENNAKCWSSGTLTMLPGSCAQLKHHLMQDLWMAHGYHHVDRAVSQLAPWQVWGIPNTAFGCTGSSAGSSYRQCSEVCTEPSIGMSIEGNQRAVARLADKKELIFLNLEHTINSYPSQYQVLLRSPTLQRSN